MAAGYSTRTMVMVAAVAAVVAVAGYWGYGAYKTRELRGAVGAILSDAGTRLREALSVEAGPPPADRTVVAKKLENHAAAIDAAIVRLKQLPVQRDRALTDDADGYLVTVREIFRKQAAMHYSYHLHTGSLGTLKNHMRADDRSGAWVSTAVIGKEKAERDFRDYRNASTAYVVLLEGFPAAEKKVERAIGRNALAPPDELTKARVNVLAASKEAAAEMEIARRFVGPR